MLNGNRTQRLAAYTLAELMAALAIIAVLAVMVIPRAVNHMTSGAAAACHANVGEIEIQAQLWRRNTGSWPAASLSDIEADLEYFPEGLPSCPVDGSTYTIDGATGRVVGHTH